MCAHHVNKYLMHGYELYKLSNSFDTETIRQVPVLHQKSVKTIQESQSSSDSVCLLLRSLHLLMAHVTHPVHTLAMFLSGVHL